MSSTTLAEYFRAQAEWREQKASEYPDDQRNAQSAAALRSLAEFVETDERAAESVKALEPFEYDTGVFQGGEQVNREVARYGYGYAVTDGTHEEVLRELVVLCLAEAYEFVAEHGDDPSGELDDFEIEAAKDGIALDIRYWQRRPKLTEHEAEQWVCEARESVA